MKSHSNCQVKYSFVNFLYVTSTTTFYERQNFQFFFFFAEISFFRRNSPETQQKKRQQELQLGEIQAAAAEVALAGWGGGGGGVLGEVVKGVSCVLEPRGCEARLDLHQHHHLHVPDAGGLRRFTPGCCARRAAASAGATHPSVSSVSSFQYITSCCFLSNGKHREYLRAAHPSRLPPTPHS